MRWVVQLTRLLLCVISMVLTALFAWQLTQGGAPGSSGGSLNLYSHWISGILWVLVGLSLDACKYCFWWYRKNHWGYGVISLLLMTFSCAASVSFFVLGEQQAMSTAQKHSVAYQAQKQSLDALFEQRERQKRLIDQRLASRFHAQWERGEEMLVALDQLDAEIQMAQVSLTTAGLSSVHHQQPHWAFFHRIGQSLKINPATVNALAYAALALFIEVCALALLSLGKMPNDPNSS